MAARNITRFWEWGRKIICVGRNYADHAKELKNAVPTEPVVFLKPPSAYVREGSPILVPLYSSNLHHEVELGVVIGKGGTSILQSDAMDHVAGYALCLDMTARDIQDECKSKGLPGPGLRRSTRPVRYISDFITLEEGDLILTGTPKGVSAVQEHDELQAGIEDVLTMTFKVDRHEH
uniref:Oxaloacetate tautomerase FAHD1, mitochondrial n=1 Tax=Neogobius melanostomus TaxID=47308 RepID=A0A8C6TQS9_9GOBI